MFQIRTKRYENTAGEFETGMDLTNEVSSYLTDTSIILFQMVRDRQLAGTFI